MSNQYVQKVHKAPPGPHNLHFSATDVTRFFFEVSQNGFILSESLILKRVPGGPCFVEIFKPGRIFPGSCKITYEERVYLVRCYRCKKGLDDCVPHYVCGACTHDPICEDCVNEKNPVPCPSSFTLIKTIITSRQKNYEGIIYKMTLSDDRKTLIYEAVRRAPPLGSIPMSVDSKLVDSNSESTLKRKESPNSEPTLTTVSNSKRQRKDDS